MTTNVYEKNHQESLYYSIAIYGKSFATLEGPTFFVNKSGREVLQKLRRKKFTIPENCLYQFDASLLTLPIFIELIFENWIFESQLCPFSIALAGALCEMMNYFEQHDDVSVNSFLKEFKTTINRLVDSLSAGMTSNDINDRNPTQLMRSRSYFKDIDTDNTDSETAKSVRDVEYQSTT